MRKICKKCASLERAGKIMNEQAKQLSDLKRENATLSSNLAEYRVREDEVTQSLVRAKQKADELHRRALVQYALECERLRVYRDKWQRYIGDKMRKNTLCEDVERTMELLRQCHIELENMIENDLDADKGVLESYRAERDRLNDEPCLDYEEIIISDKPKLERDSLSDEEIDELLNRLRSAKNR